MQRLKADDLLAMYSPRDAYPDGAPLQAFTAIGTVATGAAVKGETTPSFHPWRVEVRCVPCFEAPIRPLIEHLSFIPDRVRWGAAFGSACCAFHRPISPASPMP